MYEFMVNKDKNFFGGFGHFFDLLTHSGAAQYLETMKEETVGEKRGPMNSVNYLSHWPRSRSNLGKGRPTYT